MLISKGSKGQGDKNSTNADGRWCVIRRRSLFFKLPERSHGRHWSRSNLTVVGAGHGHLSQSRVTDNGHGQQLM